MEGRESRRRTIVLSGTGRKRLGFAEGLPAEIHTHEHLMGSASPEVRCVDIYGRTWVLTTEDIESIRP
jgi:hypothetical protein